MFITIQLDQLLDQEMCFVLKLIEPDRRLCISTFVLL